jgi:methylphosphotriester-DNA--protein-cysteine methyltransferase
MRSRRALRLDTPAVLDLITRLIREWGDPPSVADVARGCGSNVLWLRRRWHAAGRPPIRELIAHARTMEAARLLDEGMKIEAVKLMLGYRSHSNFSGQFKRRLLELPVERLRRTATDNSCRRHLLEQLLGRMPTSGSAKGRC